ncbi:MAG: response regulator transcription factor [Solirubrobacteraceae bacterium]|nr:response regulator transcription factor [Solirubrobacteraceae bacterium]
MSPVIGICEDDAALRSILVRGLEDEGFAVAAVGTGREALQRFGSDGAPDVIVLDIGLPDADGRDVCQALRAGGVTAPVVFLTARDAVVDRVAGFRSGGDDYLTKPFALVELIVRLEALLRRAAAPEPRTAVGPSSSLVLDPATHTVSSGTQHVLLTPTEFRLLGALARDAGAVVRRRTLVQAGWPDGATVHDNTLDSYLARLRRKLRGLGSSETIVTVRGVGYSLQ